MKRPPPPLIPRVFALDALRPGLPERSPGRSIEQAAKLADREGRVADSVQVRLRLDDGWPPLLADGCVVRLEADDRVAVPRHSVRLA